MNSLAAVFDHFNMQNSLGFFLLVFVFQGWLRWKQGAANRIELPPSKFWQLVVRAPEPLVVLTMSGMFRRQLRYLYPYQGLIFFTRTRPEELPRGVTVVAPSNDWS